MNIAFGQKILCGIMYIKLVAPDQLLLLSDTVCHRLGIVYYHLDVQAAHRSLNASALGPMEETFFPTGRKQEVRVGIGSNKRL